MKKHKSLYIQKAEGPRPYSAPHALGKATDPQVILISQDNIKRRVGKEFTEFIMLSSLHPFFCVEGPSCIHKTKNTPMIHNKQLAYVQKHKLFSDINPFYAQGIILKLSSLLAILKRI